MAFGYSSIRVCGYAGLGLLWGWLRVEVIDCEFGVWGVGLRGWGCAPNNVFSLSLSISLSHLSLFLSLEEGRKSASDNGLELDLGLRI